MTRPSRRREMAEKAVARHGVSIALACRAFGVRETRYRYGPKLEAENEESADLLIGLSDARKAWDFGLCFLHLRNVSCQSARKSDPLSACNFDEVDGP